MRAFVAIAMFLLVVAGLGCPKQQAVPTTTPEKRDTSPEEAASIAEEAYTFAFPMLESYRRLYTQAIDRTDPAYVGPFNELIHAAAENQPSAERGTRRRTETLRSMAWLDLRAQPIVLSVPAAKDRYYSVQLIDLFGQSFAYIGTRTTGDRAASYVIAGPRWEGTAPEQAAALLRSESTFVLCIVRVGLRGDADRGSAASLQERFAVSTLSNFVGAGLGPDAPGITFPTYNPRRAESAAFIDLVNFLLTEVSIPDDERTLLDRFEAIGVEQGVLAASLGIIPRTKAAIESGIGHAIAEIVAAAQNPGVLDGVRARSSNGWRCVDGLFGRGRQSPPDYLARAVAAKLGFDEINSDEVSRAMTRDDALGSPLDASTHDYVLRFERAELPQVGASWSVASYSSPSRPLGGNPSDVYAVLDRNELRYGEDGSVTLVIGHQPPKRTRTANWLPAPQGPFSLEVRSYVPEQKASEAPYLPPAVQRADRATSVALPLR